MPCLSKETLSQYIGTECKKQLRLNLSPDKAAYQAERSAQNMPPPQPPRPGLEQFAQAGEEWQAAKLHDLTTTFGQQACIGTPYLHATGQTRYHALDLTTALASAQPHRFLIEVEFEVTGTFEQSLGIAGHPGQFGLSYAALRPDLIQIHSPATCPAMVQPDGTVVPLPAGDQRLQLRVIDIKLTAEPSPGYYAQVVYYSMVLAGWLIDHGFANDFVVVPTTAIWPGSHDASALVQVFQDATSQGQTLTAAQLMAALEEDLEPAPFEVFAFRVARFLRDELPEVLSQPWQQLDWHVDNRCRGCDYLGYPWINAQGQPTNHADHCMPTATVQQHLSRIAFVTRGARASLQASGVSTVPALAARPHTDGVFEGHQVLRATRSVISSRANALQTQQAVIAANSGTSAVMPRWADLHIYVSADFDQGSAITVAFGAQAFWLEPRPFDSANTSPRTTRPWPAQSFVVDQRSVQVEQREVLAFLRHLNTILTDATNRDPNTSIQFYVWDTLQAEHLMRVIGRHLQAILSDQTIRNLVWLFPPEQILPNPQMATRRSPLTIVREVVRSVLAAPIPHYYSMLQVARLYHPASTPANIAQFHVHPLFDDAMSDQIPSERAHEIWSRSAQPNWSQQLTILRETVAKRLGALEAVTRQLETDLGPSLSQAAPGLSIGPPRYQTGVSADGQLWYAFAKLNEAIAQLEVQQVRAMPPHEREARYRSARLVTRLVGNQEQAVLAQLGLAAAPGRRVYELAPASREVKVRESDFNLALAPAGQPGFLDRSFAYLAAGTPLAGVAQPYHHMEDVTAVSVRAIDRDAGYIVVDPNTRWPPTILDDLEQNGIANLSTDVMLDPTHHDYFTRKLLSALQTIGNPPSAGNNPLVRQATGQLQRRGARATAHVPAADVLWDAPTMHAARVSRTLPPVQATLQQHGLDLNSMQWTAWEEALTRRLQLIWGPPGTGKSRTARAVVTGATLEAHTHGRPLRVLVSASTYNALDNVLLPIFADLQALVPSGACPVYRLRSYLQPRDPQVPQAIDVELNRYNPSGVVQQLRADLAAGANACVVGATPEQVFNLLEVGGQSTRDLFDLVLIDEASQMDVAHAILVMSALASNGSVVLAGDPKQLPPIHHAEPPLGLEAMVGSIYSFCEQRHQVPPIMLEENYRSNEELVTFARHAGYRPTLTSFSPALRLDLVLPFPTALPQGWPGSLVWTPAWSTLLDPQRPAVCFVYPDGRSSQWNEFEAEAVAAIVSLLHGRLSDQLAHERDAVTGYLRPVTGVAYSPAAFWENAVGVVTPHRAQQGLITSRLQQLFSGPAVSPSLIRDAVDTVERFQGQQRDVIIASFALGDPDAIGSEEEFLMSLNRFNVMASRARAKLIVLLSQEVLDHLSGNLDVLRASRLLKVYVEAFCNNAQPMTLLYQHVGGSRAVNGTFRWHA